MIKLIGFRRAIILVVMLALNLTIGASYVLGIVPLQEDTQNNLNSVNAQISQLSNDTQNIKADLAAFEANYKQYKEMGDRGFFLPQDRFQAGRTLDDLRAKSGLLGYAYKIDSIQSVSNPDASNGKSSLINSRITLERISSVFDMNVYTLMYNLATIFPQHTRIQKFEIKRNRKIDQAAIDEVVRNNAGLVDAEIVMDWLTVVPVADDAGVNGEFRGR